MEVLVPHVELPIDALKRYQREVFEDGSRLVAWCASRQIGKSFTGGARALFRSLVHPGGDFLIAAPSERQSLEALRKCRLWCEAYGVPIAGEDVMRDCAEALMTASVITLGNKSRIIAVPGKPDTVRGFSADCWLDEFAFFEDPDATWKAILPSISSGFGGGKSLFVSSTPNGIGGRGRRFHGIVEGGAAGWSVHKTTIFDAALELGIDVEELRRTIADEEAWRQEFCCVFADSSQVLLPYELIALAESSEATMEAPPGYWEAPSGGRRIVLGIDFGRTSDPTVCTAIEVVGELLFVREVLVLRGMDTQRQEEILRPRVERAAHVAIDATGPGVGLADYLCNRFGEWSEARPFGRVERVTFSQKLKCEIFPRLRRMFEAPTRIRIPYSAELREDLHEMRQTVTPSGGTTYDARHLRDGHSDRCVSLALAAKSAENAVADASPYITSNRSFFE